MEARLIRREIAPFLLYFVALVVAALLVDAVLHLLNAVWIGRHLGIPGVVLILGSFAYSLRKRKLISAGQPMRLLRMHERIAWLGSLLILVHAGIHFNAILAWLAVAAMLLNVGSGLTGKFLIERSRKRMDDARALMRRQGVSAEEMGDRTYWDSLTFDVVKQWRRLHMPITLAFGVLTLAHIVSVLFFWRGT